MRFAELWSDACAEEVPDPNRAAGRLMTGIAELLDVEQVEYSQEAGAALFLFELASLGFKGMDLNLVMISHPNTDERHALQQAEVLTQYKLVVGAFGYCLNIVLAPRLDAQNPFLPPHLEPIYLCGTDLERLFDSRAPRFTLLDIIRRQVSVQALCPFSTTREARGPMFKGRKYEVERLTSELDVDFAVTGARRIGKTSLLHRAHDRLKIQPHNRDRVFFFNCLSWGDSWDCFHRLAHEIDPKKELRLEEGQRNISYLLERRSHKGLKPLLLFFDEVDRIIERDAKQGWAFFRVLKGAQAKKWVRVVLAGYRALKTLVGQSNERAQAASSRLDSPFYNRLVTLSLEPLGERDTRELIEEPFENLGIPLRNSTRTSTSVWQETRGYPYLVQFYGQGIYEMASIRDPQEVLVEDMEAVRDSHAMREFMLKNFLDNTFEHGQPVVTERLCALLYTQGKECMPWQEVNFQIACQEIGESFSLDDVQRAIGNLVHSDVFEYVQGGYKFVFPMMQRILKSIYPDRETIIKSFGIGGKGNGN